MKIRPRAALAMPVSRPGLRAVDYLRVSTKQQRDGFGIAYTGKRTAAHIQRKEWEHVDTFSDEAESGTLPWWERGGAARIMELARLPVRPFDVVVVHESRAIGRESRVFWEWVWLLHDLGVFVAIVDQDIDNTTGEGEALMQEQANQAFRELIRIRDRTQGGVQEKAEEGGLPGGKPPLGLAHRAQGCEGRIPSRRGR